MAWLRHLVLALALATPAMANPLPGADDPAYQAAFASLLTSDDPAPLTALHDLAAQGNTAALLALPLAERWLPPQPNRMALRQLPGGWVRALGQAAFKPAALWQDGDISPDPRDQLDRALRLYDLAEDRKADALLKAWFNHMPMAAPLPDGLTDLNAAPMLTALILLEHLTRGDRKALAPLQDLLDHDSIAGWMVLAELNDHYPVTAGPPIQANLQLGATAGARLADGRRALRLLWHEEPPPPLPPDLLALVLTDLMPLPQFAPVRSFCAARCPATAAACEAAFVSLLGAPHHSVTQSTPLHGLMDEAAFFATPRGAQVLLAAGVKHRLGLDLAPDAAERLPQSPAFQAAKSLDVCFATAAQDALTGLPTAP
jgi:hypothetical protein